MKKLEDFLRPKQKELSDMLRKMYRGKAISYKESFVLVPGTAPIMLLAHLDTVHTEPVRDICKTQNGNILMSPQGIGGDDRCGVFALVSAYDAAPVKPWLLFTWNEEIGGIGARNFAAAYQKGKLPRGLKNLKLLVEIDRKGSKDAVYYDCDNPEFEKYITSKGFVTADGSFSDISVVAPELGVAAVNLSSYNAHTLHEYINRRQLNAVVKKVIEIVADSTAPEFPQYEYIERKYEPVAFGRHSAWADWDYWNAAKQCNAQTLILTKNGPEDGSAPLDLPSKYLNAYNELLDIYSREELEEYRRCFGDDVIWQMYEDEFGPFYDSIYDDETEDDET